MLSESYPTNRYRIVKYHEVTTLLYTSSSGITFMEANTMYWYMFDDPIMHSLSISNTLKPYNIFQNSRNSASWPVIFPTHRPSPHHSPVETSFQQRQGVVVAQRHRCYRGLGNWGMDRFTHGFHHFTTRFLAYHDYVGRFATWISHDVPIMPPLIPSFYP